MVRDANPPLNPSEAPAQVAPAREAYAELLARATADPNVVGLVLFGSRGFDAYVTDRSDFDLHVIVERDPEGWRTAHGSPVEVWPMTLDEFRDHGLPGSPSAWNRPAFLGVSVVLDGLAGEIVRIVRRKQALTPEEATEIGAAALGDYLNAVYRSLRNLEAGRDLEGRLDGLESLGPLLTAVFALEGRVRPFNKWLRHELAARPLAIHGFVELVEAIAAGPAPDVQRAMVRLIDPAARAAGHGWVIEDWQPDVAWLRGDDARRIG